MKKQIILLGILLVCASFGFGQPWVTLGSTINNNPIGNSVGIGTTTAVDKLHVIGGIRSYKDGSDAINPQLYLGNAGNSRAFSFQLSNNANPAASLNLWTYAGVAWNNRYTFKSDGNMGIGQSNPQRKLDILTSSSNDGIQITQNTDGNGGSGGAGLWLNNLTTGGRTWLVMSTGNGNTEGAGNFNIVDYTSSGASRFFIKGGVSSGAIGMGTTDPQAYLHVKGFDHGPGIIVEPGNTSIAYGTVVKVKNNSTKAFAASNEVSAAYESFIVFGNGKTKIGVTSPPALHQDAMLSVDGKIVCRDFYVLSSIGWADYVFANDYKLLDLKEVKAYYTTNKHLPGVPTAREIEEKGINISEISTIQMQKIEELTIYLVQMKEEIEKLKIEYDLLKASSNK